MESSQTQTETVQLFLPAKQDEDAQMLIRVGNRYAWQILAALGILETPNQPIELVPHSH
jgi:hypothetical protein